MALLDWIFVVFGAVVAVAGCWIQLRPERVLPGWSGVRSNGSKDEMDWTVDPKSLFQIRLLGSCFLFMGTFFALQMTIDLIHQPWWIGSVSGFVTANVAVGIVRLRVRRQIRRRRRVVQQGPLPQKALELR